MLSQYASENVRRGKTESASERKKHRRTCLQKGEVTKGSEDARHRDGHFQRGHEARGSHACLLAPATSVRTHRCAQQTTRARRAANSARRKTRMMPTRKAALSRLNAVRTKHSMPPRHQPRLLASRSASTRYRSPAATAFAPKGFGGRGQGERLRARGCAQQRPQMASEDPLPVPGPKQGTQIHAAPLPSATPDALQPAPLPDLCYAW